jgi:hypothetical protein
MALVIAGIGKSSNELAKEVGLSPGGMAYLMDEWQPQPSYAAAVAAHDASCTVVKEGVRCRAPRKRGLDYCVPHRGLVAGAVASLFGV